MANYLPPSRKLNVTKRMTRSCASRAYQLNTSTILRRSIANNTTSVYEVQNYLKRYGYLDLNTDCSADTVDNPTFKALAKFQEWSKIDATGELDDATKELMQMSRCGMPDIVDPLAFNTAGPWNHRDLKYAFGRLSRQGTSTVVRNAIRRAFDTWTNAGVGLTFMEVTANQEHDIFVEWRPAADPDHTMVGSVLAHADFPPGHSMIVTRPPLPLHFDDQEHTWVDGAVPSGYDIETVAVHEIGHCLGMYHTDVTGSVMFPRVGSNLTLRALGPDDLAGIRTLYPGSNPAMFSPTYAEGDPGHGIGGYDLKSTGDRAFTLDYDHKGKADHLCFYRPGTGTMWILKKGDGGAFRPVYQQGDPGQGIGGYDLKSAADRAFAFDYDHSGKLDHICLYRPGTGTLWILKNSDGFFRPVYSEGDPGNGIGGYDLKSPNDRAFAFDYDHSGKLDHLCLFRPGTGTLWILKNVDGFFRPVFQQGDPGQGIGGYDLKSLSDLAFAYDYDGTGKLDHIALYRPGTGTMWILQHRASGFVPVYQQGDPGLGIGGYDLKSAADQAFAFDFQSTGRLDHIALYRPGTGTMWILQRRGSAYVAVYHQGDPGLGIGGYDLRSTADRAFAFDYSSVGKLDHVVLIRPGTGTCWILRRNQTML